MHRVVVFLFALFLATGCGRSAPKEAPAENVTTPSPAAPANLENASAMLGELTQAVRKYAAEQKKVPASLDEVVSNGYLPAVPQAPAGKKFSIDKKLQVYLADQ